MKYLIGLRTFILAAHAPDATVDGVRFLQLVEAMKAVVAADELSRALADCRDVESDEKRYIEGEKKPTKESSN